MQQTRWLNGQLTHIRRAPTQSRNYYDCTFIQTRTWLSTFWNFKYSIFKVDLLWSFSGL